MATEFNGKKRNLKWLFIAQFEDGSRIEQDQNDQSTTREGGSQFTDVLARQEQVKLTNFALINNGVVYELDLLTGAFFANNEPFFLGEILPDENIHSLQKRDFKLIFFRRNYDNHVIPARVYDPQEYKILPTGELEIINNQGERLVFPDTAQCSIADYTDGDKRGKVFTIMPQENFTITHYYMGWEVNIQGKNYKQLLRLI